MRQIERVKTNKSQLIVHQAYRIGASQYGLTQWRIAFLCPLQGTVEIFRCLPKVSDEFEQSALVRQAIEQFINA